MAETVICECVPIERIRTQVVGKYRNINCRGNIHQETWSMYPCGLDEADKCRSDHCDGRISFSVTTPTRDVKIITALFIRSEKGAYALRDRSLRSLFEEGLLETVVPVDKELNDPLIRLPVKSYKNP